MGPVRTASTIIQERPALANRFEIIEVLGEGAAGAVYRVRDREHKNAEVALKVLTNREAFDEHTWRRFVEELKACQRIEHPNLVKAYDLIRLPDTISFTMEFVEGSTLGSLCKVKRFSIEEIGDIMKQLLGALEELHRNGIVHRDIKLENIMLRKDGRLKLVDLGLLKKLNTQGYTDAGILLGTAQYMPPEYIRHSQYDARGDIYAAGLAMYELLTGKRYLANLNGQKAIKLLMKNNFAVPCAPLPEIPESYERFLEGTLAADPKKRFSSANEAAAVLAGESPATAGKSVPAGMGKFRTTLRMTRPFLKLRERRLSKKLKAVGGVLLLAIAAVAIGIPSAPSSLPLGSLDEGDWSGELHMFGNTGFYKSVALTVKGSEISFRSGLKECPHGRIDPVSGVLKCPSAEFALRLKSAQNGRAEGVIINPAQKDNHPFVLKKQ